MLSPGCGVSDSVPRPSPVLPRGGGGGGGRRSECPQVFCIPMCAAGDGVEGLVQFLPCAPWCCPYGCGLTLLCEQLWIGDEGKSCPSGSGVQARPSVHLGQKTKLVHPSPFSWEFVQQLSWPMACGGGWRSGQMGAVFRASHGFCSSLVTRISTSLWC